MSPAKETLDDDETFAPRTARGEPAQNAWRRPVGVSVGTWRYAHEGTIASRYDDFVAATPLCRVDLQMTAGVFPGPSSGPQAANRATSDLDGQANPTEDAASEKKWILDLGCGTGRASAVLSEAGYDVLAVDLSLPMLAEVRQRQLPRVLPMRANLVELECLADSFATGAVCLFSTLGMIQGRENRRRFLANVRRIVQPGGQFLLHVHNRYAAVTHSAGRRQLIASRMKSWLQKDMEFGDAVYPYRGLPDMFLHQFSRRELTADLRHGGWQVAQWSELSLDSSQRMAGTGIAGGFLVVAE
ncbi:Methyltransferase domain-containing protein [Neorhodopirellula lusitana]|uniref:Methyltransferase domain-containing protein n=1 Tax=Neorhodopirellula lusitana TaxID=445327 RepID=A0ABY1QMG0_9BACT|nr:class I SAM-dependent methyltransferase [Neorhodopirellula lusitana]SMP75311.1 Methyltransferase domain-containing protein [Neorhodopirellula lusitana]